MIFLPTPLNGLFLIELEIKPDERGFFARSWCRDELAAAGLNSDIQQCNISFNAKRGIIRGMHYQTAPYGEVKIVRCTLGAIFDVAVNINPLSPQFGQWWGTELCATNHRALYIPEGFAHGFLTLTPQSEISYQMSKNYAPTHAKGFRWNDPEVGIQWPFAAEHISERDANLPYLKDVV